MRKAYTRMLAISHSILLLTLIDVPTMNTYVNYSQKLMCTYTITVFIKVPNCAKLLSDVHSDKLSYHLNWYNHYTGYVCEDVRLL